ncbi:MAG: ABC transporter ATP-binding protein [Coriobacteriales bacterium]|jgi:putative ABC transport system ATP-binding protein|nr:ABC transporter ATP-binding protein [Coriobacteriales bacterium]
MEQAVTASEQTIIQTNKLCKTFSTGGVQQHVLKNLDLSINRGDFTVIMGASGAGKSTLLYALSGMDKPTLGKVAFDGRDITALSNDRLAVFRRKNCGFIFQQIYLMDNMSLMDNVLASGLLVSRDRKALAQRARELFGQVGLSEQDWRKFPAQLSGGEAQRGAVVRALINKPAVLFADEPTGALNSTSGTAVLDLLTQISRDGQSVVLVTHDIRSACRGNRVLYLQDGSLQGELDLGWYEEEGIRAKAGDDIENDTVVRRTERLRGFLADRGW